jgi:hypothetical protein
VGGAGEGEAPAGLTGTTASASGIET